jgi:hypothetical protein
VWLALTSIVLASAIGFNVIALWVIAWFERRQPESPSFTQWNTNADIRRFIVKFDSQIVPILPKRCSPIRSLRVHEETTLFKRAGQCVS